jgi:hypothetical protein
VLRNDLIAINNCVKKITKITKPRVSSVKPCRRGRAPGPHDLLAGLDQQRALLVVRDPVLGAVHLLVDIAERRRGHEGRQHRLIAGAAAGLYSRLAPNARRLDSIRQWGGGLHAMWTGAAAALAALASAHVPIYPDGLVATIDRDANISQVVYFPGGAGRVVVPQKYLPADKQLFIDVIIRDEADYERLNVTITCGTNAPGQPQLTSDLEVEKHLHAGELEPFTQTGYFSILENGGHDHGNEGELFNLTDCTGDLRIGVFYSATDADPNFAKGPIGIVIGKAETFTFGELMSFGHYMYARFLLCSRPPARPLTCSAPAQAHESRGLVE